MRGAFLVLLLMAGTGSEDREILAAHNAVRKRVGVAPLKWSNRLAANSQEWAETLLARRQFAHRPNPVFGENLFIVRGAEVRPSEVVNAWADEARNYDYRSNRCYGVCGHYTQIVWDGTQEVGCGVARGESAEIWVCNYDPPGNWEGKRPF